MANIVRQEGISLKRPVEGGKRCEIWRKRGESQASGISGCGYGHGLWSAGEGRVSELCEISMARGAGRGPPGPRAEICRWRTSTQVWRSVWAPRAETACEASAAPLSQELQCWFVGLGLDTACWVGQLRHQQHQSAPSCEQPGTTVEVPPDPNRKACSNIGVLLWGHSGHPGRGPQFGRSWQEEDLVIKDILHSVVSFPVMTKGHYWLSTANLNVKNQNCED